MCFHEIVITLSAYLVYSLLAVLALSKKHQIAYITATATATVKEGGVKNSHMPTASYYSRNWVVAKSAKLHVPVNRKMRITFN